MVYKITPEEVYRLEANAVSGPWTNVCPKRGKKKSVWLDDPCLERSEPDGVTPSRYGPDRTIVCNVLESVHSIAPGHNFRLDAQANADFIAATPAMARLISKLETTLLTIDALCPTRSNVDSLHPDVARSLLIRIGDIIENTRQEIYSNDK